MSKKTVFNRKFSFSFLALLTLLIAFVSVSFGTIGYSAGFIGNAGLQEGNNAFGINSLESIIKGEILTSNLSSSPNTTFIVNNNGDSNDATLGDGVCADSLGNCTLRAAIQEANSTPAIDEITFAFTTPTTIQLNSSISPGELLISRGLTITGPGARLLTVNGNSNTLSGVFNISYAGTSTTNISGITIANSDGRGINNDARLNLSDVTVKGNRYGIYNSGKLDITRALVTGNSSGGIYLTGSSSVNISNTTVTNNASTDNGGGIYTLSSDVTLNNVTISHNTATTNGGGLYYNAQGAGIYIRNTIIAKNTATAGSDIFTVNGLTGALFVSRGNNFIGKSDVNTGFTNNVNNDKVGTNAAPIDPLLGTLQNNGGTTDTRALASGSTAKDAGNACVINSTCPTNNPTTALLTDQRGTGFPRNYESGVDIGAFETFYPVASISSFVPNNWGTGKGAFELVINGNNFVADSIVKWNGQNKTTTFISNTQIKAQILASDVATAGQYPVTVVNPLPGGGPSDAVNFTVTDCSYSINPTSQIFTPTGGSGSVAVTATNGCAWTATTTAAWIAVTAGNNGTGPGTVSFTVAANNGQARTGTISVAGQTFTVNQTDGCTYSITPAIGNYSAAASTNSFNLTTSNSGCTWTATTAASWITINNPSGTGAGTINFTISANTGPARNATITVNGQTFTINQASGCNYLLTPSNASFDPSGGTRTFNVTTATGCVWSAASNDSWITINSGASGTGSGTVSYSVAANQSPSRTGTITVNGQTFTITQTDGCVYSLSSTSLNASAGGENGSVNITANNGCQWSAVSNVPWISVITGANGTGNGTVTFSVAANNGLQRSGTITIAGQTFTVTQANGCTFGITPSNQNFNASGGAGTFSVTASNAACSWNPVANDSWINITSSPNGTGNGSVNFSVSANTGPARNGSITVGGKTFAISQDNGCTYSLSTPNANVPAGGGTGNFVVNSNAGCAWNAQSNDAWITITGGSNGSGSGTVTFSVATNVGLQRSGTISVGGQTFTITQTNGCTYSLSSVSTNSPATGLSGSVSVTASAAECPWTAASNDAWITVTNGLSGTGSGTVQFTVAANTGPARTGTITIAGKTFTVTQDSGCTFELKPPNTSFNSAGGSGSFNVTPSNAACTWTAVTTDAWITINSGASGTGNGIVSFTVAANVSPQRTGTINVNGQGFTISQSNGCNFNLSPPSYNASAAGAASNFNINSGAGCQWNVQSNDAWITVTSGSSGTGGGVVTFTVAQNIGPARSGTITAGGQTFTVNQSNGCTYIINPNSISVPNSGGNGSVSVTASNGGCIWSAASNDAWITVTAGATGTGNGTVTYSVAANTSPQRNGTITIGGQTVTVNQENGCVYSISSTSLNINESGGPGSFNITSGIGCQWNTVSNDSWITITSGISGNGNGTISFSVQSNSGDSRTGTITVAGLTFTVNQVSLIVTNLNDSGVGSLRQAVINANNTPGNDVITFRPSLVGAINLTSGEITITNNGAVTIQGPGTLTLTISGNNNSRIFYTNNANVTITDVTLMGGNGVGASSGTTNRWGGAIYVNGGTLNLNHVQVIRNIISSDVRGVGGGVYFFGGTNHLIQNSTFYGNECSFGGAFSTQNSNVQDVDVRIVNSTLSANVAYVEGGGIYSAGNTTVRNVTIANNSSTNSDPIGGGISVWSGEFNVGNTIIADNTGPEISFHLGVFRSVGNNLIGDSNGDSANTITPVAYQSTDILDTPPKLGRLGSYGGATTTLALLPESVAINAGNNALAVDSNGQPLTSDQRNSTRIIGGTVDIGAFENNIVVSPTNPVLPDGTVNAYYSQSITATRLDGNASDPFRYFITEGALPDGLTLSLNGLIQGVPTSSGVYTFTVTATGIDFIGGANQYTIAVGCPFTISPSSKSFDASGGSGTINLTTSPGCSWTPTSAVPWITITSNLTGSGNGTINYTVAANTGISRIGKITVGGQTFTVNQTTGCSLTLSSSSMDVPTSGGTGTFNINAGTGCTWSSGSNVPWITITSGSNGIGGGAVNFSVTANTGAARSGTITAGGQSFMINQAAGTICTSCNHTRYDFDGDGRADVSVYRPSNGAWYLLNSTSGFTATQFGIATDKIVPADYDGDGKTDIAVYRDGTWYLQRSSLGFTGVGFGQAGDIPVAADFDGDGKADLAVYRPANGVWYILNLATNQFSAIQFGQAGDIPVAADFDGDGKADIAVYRASQGTWYIQRSRDGFTAAQFGISTDKPIPADYDGDGKTDLAVFRPDTGSWYVQQSRDGFKAFQFGIATDNPAPADYDGDGKADIAVYRDGTWYIQRSRDGFTAIGFGAVNDKPIASAFLP